MGRAFRVEAPEPRTRNKSHAVDRLFLRKTTLQSI
jgi:hypothetical protein